MTDRVSPLRPDAEFYDNGLLDRLLGLRSAPDPAILVMAKSTRQSEIAKASWAAAIDATLDILVPPLKKIAMMSMPASHGANCIAGNEVRPLIGRVPLDRTPRGWRS